MYSCHGESVVEYNFETVHSLDLYGCELAPTVREGMRAWNMTVQYWLATYVYKRLPVKAAFIRFHFLRLVIEFNILFSSLLLVTVCGRRLFIICCTACKNRMRGKAQPDSHPGWIDRNLCAKSKFYCSKKNCWVKTHPRCSMH